MDAPPPVPTIRALLTKLCDEMILEAEMERASRPPAQTARFGTLPPVRSLEPAGVALREMMSGDGEGVPVPDEDLVEDHPLGRMPAAARVPEDGARCGTATPPPDLASPARRAAFFAGLSGYMARAARKNDLDLADGVVERLLAKHAPGVILGEAERNLLRRSALLTLSSVHGINADRERGAYAVLPADDPALDLPLATASPPPLPEAGMAAEANQPARLELKRLSEAYADYECFMTSPLAKDARWTNQTQRQNAMTVRLFIDFAGDLPLDRYSDEDASGFKVALQHLPRLHGRSPDWRLPMRDAVERVKALMDSGKDLPECLAMKTIKRHMSALSGLFVWLKERAGEYRYKGPNHFQGHRYGRTETKREMWDSEDLAALFRTPIWTGCDPARRAKPGATVIYDAYYWLPLLATFHGLRQEEIAQLRASDIQREDDVWFLNIHDDNGNHMKTEASERRVPIHATVIALGFLDYVALFRRSQDHLWPTLKRGGPDGKFAHYYTQRFTAYCRQTGIYDSARPFHALRASFRTFLEETDAKSVHISKLVGHSLTPVLGEGGRYTKRIRMSTLKQAIDRFDPQVDLSHLVPFDPIRHMIVPEQVERSIPPSPRDQNAETCP